MNKEFQCVTKNKHINSQTESTHWRRWVKLRIILPYLSLPALPFTIFYLGVAWYDITLLVVGLILTGIGFSVGLHRYYTHHSFKTLSAVRALLGIFGLMGSHLTIKEYVAIHRAHHAAPDEPEDPHSPHHTYKGNKGALVGLLYSHSGWLLSPNLEPAEKVKQLAKDYHHDPLVNALDNRHHTIILLSMLVPAAVGFAIAGTWEAALSAMLWGGLFRLFITDQIECWGRGISHYYGSSPMKTRGMSANHWTAFISMGEWHNNHHAFPNSSRQGFEHWQLDTGYLVIVLLEKLHLAWDIIRVDKARIDAKRIVNQ